MKIRLCTLLAFIFLPLLAEAQLVAQAPKESYSRGIWPFRINRIDSDGKFHGMWKIQGPNDETIIRKGRFRHGREVGTWRYYYYPSGNLYMVEKHKRKLEYIPVKRYHENGTLEKEGQVRVEDTPEKIRYFWFGEWKVYDETGNFSHTEYYVNGNQVVLKE